MSSATAALLRRCGSAGMLGLTGSRQPGMVLEEDQDSRLFYQGGRRERRQIPPLVELTKNI